MDQQTTITEALPPDKILKILLLQRRNDVIVEIESYLRRRNNGSGAPEHLLCASVQTLFFDLEAALMQSDKEKYKKIAQLAITRKASKAITAFRLMNEFLYQKGVTRFDVRKKIDTTRVELENAEMGLH